MRHLALLLGLSLGCMLQVQEPTLQSVLCYGLCLIAACAGLLLAWPLSRRIRSAWGRLVLVLALFSVLLLAGMFSWSLTGLRALAFLRTAMPATLEGKDLQVTGVIAAMPQRLASGLRFRFDVESARDPATASPVLIPPRVQLTWYNEAWGRDADPTTSTLQPRPGERWQWTVRLKAPHGNINPHGFDYELWLWDQNIQATGYVRDHPQDTEGAALPPLPPLRLTRGAWWPSEVIERARQSVRDAVFQTLPDKPRSAGVIAALITGDQSAIERADWEIFRATGVAHLMSISGLHITLFAWLAAWVVGWLWRRTAIVQAAPLRALRPLCLWYPSTQVGLIAGVVLATLYAWFSGWGVPAQRTIWMLTTFSLLRLLGLRWPWWMSWLVAMAVILMIDPWACLSPGFWLSFVAVGVLFASEPGHSLDQVKQADLATARTRAWMPFRRFLREQSVITVALAPLSLVLFQQVSLVGSVANAVAIPLITLLVTPLVFLGVLLRPLWHVAAWLLERLQSLLHALAALPMSTWQLPAAPLWINVLAVAGAVLMVIPQSTLTKHTLKLKVIWRIPIGAALIAPLLLWPIHPTNAISKGHFDLRVTDIGQGNAVLVQTQNHSLLYDTGARFSNESDAGKRVLVPLLRALGVRLDALVLSHRDSDHTGGAAALLQYQPGTPVISSLQWPQESVHIDSPQHVPHTPCTMGLRWQWDGVTFEVLHPLASDLVHRDNDPKPNVKPNALSCVLRITDQNGKAALLVGDLEARQEEALIRRGAPLQAHALLVPHHGSKTSSSPAFLAAVHPSIAFIQAGYRNRYSHPHPEVLARYSANHIAVVRSDACGAALWHSQAPNEVQCERAEHPRYWHHALPLPLPPSLPLPP